MERKLASVQIIENLSPIPGADKIEMAKVLGWSVVVGKGQFSIGQKIVFCEIDSLLPINNEAWAFMARGNSPKKMLINNIEHVGYRLKTAKFKGQISQGLVLPMSVLPSLIYDIGCDVSMQLGIVKYEPPIPACLSGKVKGVRPAFIPKTDEMRVQAIPEVLKWQGVQFRATEKLDGASVSVFNFKGEFGVCSRNLELTEDENNSIWKAVNDLGLRDKLKNLNIVLQGEIVGEGIQGNPLKIKGQKIYFFNAYDPVNAKYLDWFKMKPIFKGWKLERVPDYTVEYYLPKTVEEMVAYVSNLKSKICADAVPEGVIFRPIKETTAPNLGRLSFKCINPHYLLKHEI